MNATLAAAGAIGAAAFVTHTFVGTRYAIPPLLAARSLPAATRGLNFLCWHIVTLLLLVMAVTASLGAVGRVSGDAVAVVGIVAACISAVSVVAARQVGIVPWRFPASWLLGAMAVAVFLGLAG